MGKKNVHQISIFLTQSLCGINEMQKTLTSFNANLKLFKKGLI